MNPEEICCLIDEKPLEITWKTIGEWSDDTLHLKRMYFTATETSHYVIRLLPSLTVVFSAIKKPNETYILTYLPGDWINHLRGAK